MPYTPKTTKEILAELIGLVVSQGTLTDVEPSSVLTHILAL